LPGIAPDSHSYEVWRLVAEWLTAFGTIAVAVLAIWGDWIRNFFVAPKIEISLVDPQGDLTSHQDGRKVRYYHLRITKIGKSVATNCRVVLRDVQRRDQKGQYHTVPNIPLPLTWTPSWLGIYVQNISTDAVVDFGFLVKDSDKFVPALLGGIAPINFRGFVGANEEVRYGIELVADNFSTKTLHYFDVKWDGRWDDDDDKMQLYLTVVPAQD
jgi:hypothetical protein